MKATRNLSKSPTPPLLLLISAIVLIVSGCGGGGGGGSGGGSASAERFFHAYISGDSRTITPLGGVVDSQINELIDLAIPFINSGDIEYGSGVSYQSSTRGGSAVAPIVTVDNDNNPSISGSTTPNVKSDLNEGEIISAAHYLAEGEGNRAIVYTTDFEHFGYWIADDDGTWANDMATTSTGVFSGSTRAPTSAGFFTTAMAGSTGTYKGDAGGIFMDTHNNEDRAFINQFIGKVSLTANFDGSGVKIGGSISDIEWSTPNGNPAQPMSVMLGETPTSTNAQVSGAATSEFENSFEGTGSWGGQFYGTEAQSFGGTFAVDLFEAVVVYGSFSAEKVVSPTPPEN